jgi:anti-sigma regulatory factor (Ser/Thr protein kinase)
MKSEMMHLESSLGNLAKAREFVVKKAKESGATEADVTKIEISCDEWSANVIEHGLKKDSSKNFSIQCKMKGKKFIVVYEHEGVRFNPIEQQMVNLNEHFSSMKERGLGIYIMREMMDEIHYEYIDDRINKLTLVKYIEKV